MCGSWRRRCFVLATSIPKKRLRIVRQLGQRASRTTYKKDNCKRTSRPNKHSILPPEFSIPFTICLNISSTLTHLNMTTPSPESKSEMMFLGQECNHPACYLHDFLPFNVSIFWMNDGTANADKSIVPGMPSCFLPASLSSIPTFM